MNNSIDKATLMAYLYDELDEATRQKVTAYLQKHPEVAAELSEMNKVRNILAEVPDFEIPSMIFPSEPKQKKAAKTKKLFHWTRLLAAMFALCLLALVGLNTKIQWEEKGLSIQFGQVNKSKEIPNNTFASADQLTDLSAKIEALQLQLANITQAYQATDYNQRIQNLENRKYLTAAKVNQIFEKNFKKKIPQLVASIQNESDQDAAYKEILNELWEQIQTQRQLDLEAIAGEFIQIKNVVNNYQQETGEVFQNILSNTNSK